MKTSRFLVGVTLSAALASGMAMAADGKVSRERLDRAMSSWSDDVRANAEILVSRYGLPDRITDTALVWDTQSPAQQTAMVSTVAHFRTRAEAGEGWPRE